MGMLPEMCGNGVHLQDRLGRRHSPSLSVIIQWGEEKAGSERSRRQRAPALRWTKIREVLLVRAGPAVASYARI